MNVTVNDGKTALRRACRQRRRALPDHARQAADVRIRQHLAALPEWSAADVVAGFYPHDGEPDLRPLLAERWLAGKSCCFPRSAGDGAYCLAALPPPSAQATFADCFQPGRFAIPEPRDGNPVPPEAEILWLIPGVAFDHHGRRLGRGGGFYDRLLHGRTGLRIAVAYDHQIVAAVPAEPHDEPVAWLVAESGIHCCRPLTPPERKMSP